MKQFFEMLKFETMVFIKPGDMIAQQLIRNISYTIDWARTNLPEIWDETLNSTIMADLDQIKAGESNTNLDMTTIPADLAELTRANEEYDYFQWVDSAQDLPANLHAADIQFRKDFEHWQTMKDKIRANQKLSDAERYDIEELVGIFPGLKT